MPKLLSILFALFSLTALSQPDINWTSILGGSLDDYPYQIEATSDGGYIIVGTTTSSDGDIRESFNERDIWVVKLCTKGLIQWERCLGGNGTEFGQAIIETYDRGYLVTGGTYSSDEMVSEAKGSCDVWAVKLDQTGVIQWEQSYGGTDFEIAFDVSLCPDRGYVFAANSRSDDGDVGLHYGPDYESDFWIFKINAEGDLVWSQVYGGTYSEEAHSLVIDPDGNIVVVGFTESNDGDITEAKGADDVWLVKLDPNGNLIWQKTYGGSNTDKGYSIVNAEDGNFIVAGYSFSDNGDISGTTTRSDYWMFKIDRDGNLLWEKTYGGTNYDIALNISATNEGRFIVGGYRAYTAYKTPDSSTASQGFELWLVEIDEFGVVFWEQTARIQHRDFLLGATVQYNGDYAIVGYSEYDEDMGEDDDHRNITVIEFNTGTESAEQPCFSDKISVSPNPAGDEIIVYHPGQRVPLIQLYNINGVVQKTWDLPTFSQWSSLLDISELPPGVYFVETINELGERQMVQLLRWGQ